MSAREYWDNQWIRAWYQSALVLSVALFTLSCDKRAAGQSLRLMLNLDDPVCGFELYTCRRVRIGSSSRGMLTIEVRPDNAAAQFGVVRAGQEPGVGTTDRLSVPVVAGVETMIEIVIFSGRFPEGFTLNTSLEFR